MKLGTANIRNFPDMTPAQVAEDAVRVAVHTTICGLQEIRPDEDTDVVQAALGPHWAMVGTQLETPIAYRRHVWHLLEVETQKFHRPDLPRPQSRFGGITSAVFASVKRRHLPPFAVVNSHLVSGGMNGPRLPVIADRWLVEWGLYVDTIQALHRRGFTVLTTGDLNNSRPPAVPPLRHWEWLNPDAKGPDHLGQLEAPATIGRAVLRSPAWQTYVMNSDHPLHVVTGPFDHVT